MISRWALELLGCHFTVIHRPARMMRDVDALKRRFKPMIDKHMMIVTIFSARDQANIPTAYEKEVFAASKTASLSESSIAVDKTPLLIDNYVDNTLKYMMLQTLEESSLVAPEQIMTSPIMLVHAAQIECAVRDNEYTDIQMRKLDIPDSMELNWLCINDITGSALHWISFRVRVRVTLTLTYFMEGK